MIDFLTILLLVFGVLQIILFFKVWGMTNDVSKIKDLLESKISKNQVTKEFSPVAKEISTLQQSPQHSEKEESLNNINVGDKVIRLSNGKVMVVDSIDDGQFFCKGSFLEGYAYYKREEIEKVSDSLSN